MVARDIAYLGTGVHHRHAGWSRPAGSRAV